MNERGRLQRALDTVVQWNRDHQGTVAGGTVFIAGAGAAVARVEGAPIALAVGGITLAVSSGVDYMNNVLGPEMRRAFSTNETTIMDSSEIQSLLAASAEERPASS